MSKIRLYALFLLSLSFAIASSVNGQDTLYLLDNDNFREYLNAENTTNGTYQLIENIILTGPQSPIGSGSIEHPLRLELNGDGYSISGINVTTEAPNTPAGLFGFLVDSWVHHLFLDQPHILSTGDGSPAGAVVGEMTNSKVTDVINHQGVVRTEGDSSAAGGLVGRASSSTVSGNLNSGAVSTEDIAANAGGIVGTALSNSVVSGNLNTGAVSTMERYAFAGGAVGWTSGTVSGNLNIGAVSTEGDAAFAGGTVGRAYSSSMVSGNLNIGAVSTEGSAAFAGGTVGRASSSSMVSGNLNIGAVSTEGGAAFAGGAVGWTNGTVSDNLNSGAVTTKGIGAIAGGAVGWTNGTVSDNLNSGAVTTKGTGAIAGGAVGKAYSAFRVSGNLNAGAVSTEGSDAFAGGAVGQAFSSRVSGNLNDGAVSSTQANSGSQIGNPVNNNATVVPINGLGELNGAVWAAGEDGKFPMLKKLNAAYRDLQRIDGTRYGNNTFTFPTELDRFAEPGGFVHVSLFDSTVWNVRDGYLPFLKHMGRARADAAGIDCSEGGFAYDCGPADLDCINNCPVPVGVPVFQAYDNENQRLYVVARETENARNLMLIRYRGRVLDESFGNCGKVIYRIGHSTPLIRTITRSPPGCSRKLPTAPIST